MGDIEKFLKESKGVEETVKELLKDHPITDMVKFSDIDLQEKLEDNPYLIVKYRELYYGELSKLDSLQDKLDKLIGIRYDHYRFESDRELTKSEIERYYIPKDKQVLQMKAILRRQEVRVRFFETCFKGLEKMQWSMKSFIDVLKSGY
jgi:DNA helicase TIP49 (TBP-interacting protein)